MKGLRNHIRAQPNPSFLIKYEIRNDIVCIFSVLKCKYVYIKMLVKSEL